MGDGGDYVQAYRGEDAVCNLLPGTHSWWWWCEHDDGSHVVLEARPGGSPSCPDCGTRWAVWQRGVTDVLAKPVVVRIG